MNGYRVAVEPDRVWPADTETTEAVVANWFARPGKRVSEGEILCEIQIDKVSVDVPAPAAGTLDEVLVGEHGEFAKGDRLAWVRVEGG